MEFSAFSAGMSATKVLGELLLLLSLLLDLGTGLFGSPPKTDAF
jgi:hypothetical protein